MDIIMNMRGLWNAASPGGKAVNISTLNFRFRYNPVDGNDLYLVYNDILNNGLLQEVPDTPLSDNRTIMLKYVHTFR